MWPGTQCIVVEDQKKIEWPGPGVRRVYNPSAQKVEAGGSEVPGHSLQRDEFQGEHRIPETLSHKKDGGGDTAQQLGALPALVEDLGSIPSTHIRQFTSNQVLLTRFLHTPATHKFT